jgi:hypothetical protein
MRDEVYALHSNLLLEMNFDIQVPNCIPRGRSHPATYMVLLYLWFRILVIRILNFLT